MTGPLAAACNGYSLLVARLRRLAPFFIYLYIYTIIIYITMAVVAAETCWSLDDYKSQRRLFPLYNINFFFLSLPPLQWPYIRQVRKDEHNKPLVLSTETLDDGEGEETVTERFDSSFCCMSSSSSLNLFFFSCILFVRRCLIQFEAPKSPASVTTTWKWMSTRRTSARHKRRRP